MTPQTVTQTCTALLGIANYFMTSRQLACCTDCVLEDRALLVPNGGLRVLRVQEGCTPRTLMQWGMELCGDGFMSLSFLIRANFPF